MNFNFFILIILQSGHVVNAREGECIGKNYIRIARGAGYAYYLAKTKY